MKKLNKIVAGALASALTLALGGIFTACGGGNVDYTFEAEDAVTEGVGTAADQSQSQASVETDQLIWTENGDGEETVSGLGGFNAVGQKIIWTVVADKACEVTITLHAASAQMKMDETYQFAGLDEVDLGNADAYAMKVNDAAATLKGTLPETTVEGGWAAMGTPGLWWHLGTATCKANLKAGENTIVFEIVGQATMMGSGVNVDKIVISSPVKLSAKAA